MASVVKFENSYYMSEKVKSINTKYQAWLTHDKPTGVFTVVVLNYIGLCEGFESPILIESTYNNEQDARYFFDVIVNNKFNECQRLGIRF